MKKIEAIIKPFKLEEVKDALSELGIEGMIPPFKLTCANHEGSDKFRMMQWDGTKFQMVTDWVSPPDPVFIRKLIEESAAKYAAENNITPRKCS